MRYWQQWRRSLSRWAGRWSRRAAPGAGNANDVINELKANGYRVIITKSGAGDMSKCTVTSVEKQSPVTDVGAGRDAQNYPTTVPVTSRKIAVVALRC
ncbi:hypothetical protein I542_0211 [Mycobacteroides abscessus 1948]|uniref:Uncharacterized protein n=1 Tax=Mycobacteroides abscessus 1948 TaxID=1299323 RepID=A0A829QB49_9MYCO|nr:hypothetical protein I542_0211 [Mycobacteroides abscessus 1948]